MAASVPSAQFLFGACSGVYSFIFVSGSSRTRFEKRKNMRKAFFVAVFLDFFGRICKIFILWISLTWVMYSRDYLCDTCSASSSKVCPIPQSLILGRLEYFKDGCHPASLYGMHFFHRYLGILAESSSWFIVFFFFFPFWVVFILLQEKDMHLPLYSHMLVTSRHISQLLSITLYCAILFDWLFQGNVIQ